MTDATTFKQQGLSQHCEIRVRFWSTKFDEVQEAFLDNSVGHETAAIQVEHMKESLYKDGLSQCIANQQRQPECHEIFIFKIKS